LEKRAAFLKETRRARTYISTDDQRRGEEHTMHSLQRGHLHHLAAAPARGPLTSQPLPGVNDLHSWSIAASRIEARFSDRPNQWRVSTIVSSSIEIDGVLARTTQSAPLARGGLPPKCLQRVRAYIDQNLDQAIDIKTLADVAGYSLYHFARAFKQSQGCTPCCYLFQRRVHRAQQMLSETTLPIAEIAAATGFSDQSHFSRRFREHAGVAPAQYRRSVR
jgi:AraC-like DNA-binding protein